MENQTIVIEKIEGKMHSVGIDMTLVQSLVNFIDSGLNDCIDVSHTDIINMTVILKRLVTIMKSKYEKIERILNI